VKHLLFIALFGVVSSAHAANDFWLADRYGVKLSFDASDRGKLMAPTVKSVPIAYPGEMLRSGIEGIVKVSYDVLEDGSVAHVKVVKSSLDAFEPPVLEAVTQWHFYPAISLATQKPVRAEMTATVEFVDEDEGSVEFPKLGATKRAAKGTIRVVFDQAGKVLHTSGDWSGELSVALSGRFVVSTWEIRGLSLPVTTGHGAIYPRTSLYIGKEPASISFCEDGAATGVLTLDPSERVSFPWQNTLLL
jgi:TonB family protein